MIPMRLAALAMMVVPGVAMAQVRPGTPGVPGRPGISMPRSTLPRDTTQRDSTRADSVEWSPPDSVMRALLAKPGYTVTRYEGGVVTFDALTKALAIAAEAAGRAIVQRDSMRAVTDTQIVYDDRTNSIDVSGRFNITLGAGQAPVQGRGTAHYNLARRTGRLTNATTTVDESGERWFIRSQISIPVLGDSARGIQPRFYGLGGTLTSCDDSVAHYHFAMKEVKRTEKTLVARPAVLYLKDIPVMWLPFVFQDIRPGRRSGILPPGFGASDIVRNNPGYRRYVENIGFYWALSDYADMAMWADWRSSAGADSLDPGWYQVNGEWKYAWLSRFLSGRLATSYMKERTGDDKLSVSWNHQQRFSTDRSLSANINYTTSPTLQRRNTFLPAAAIATIGSQINLTDKLGPLSWSFGGSQRQYPGRKQLDRTLPTLTVNSTPIAWGERLVWTPSFSYSETATLHMDTPGTFATALVADADGRVIRADSLDRNSFDRSISIGSPLRVFGLDLTQNIRIHEQFRDYPDRILVVPDADSSRQEYRVFPTFLRTDIDWNPVLSLPPFFQNRFKLTPSVTLQNVDPGPYWVRTNLSGGKFVHQAKRLAYGVSASPTIFGLWPGFGPFQRFRHSLSPTLSYSFAPAARVSDDYLEAIGQNKQVYLGSLAQNSVTFGLSQNIEGKVRSADTSATDAQKLKVLTMTFSSFTYDFERARKTGRKLSGITTETFSTSLRSDLVPGFDLSMNYSLFEGSTQTDTARFAPFLTNISSRLQLSRTENPLTVITRLFGRAVPERSPPVTSATRPEEAALMREIAQQPVAGQAARGRQFVTPPTEGWQASLSFTTSQSRPVRGTNVIQYDPRIRCEQFRTLNPFLYDECLRAPNADQPPNPIVGGAPIVQMPRQSSITGDMRFALTPKWAASWNTSYDFTMSQFASHVVSLQRDLHDWRAIFNFTHSPNGNFAFSFFIALKPQPDLKFDYSRATVRAR